MQKKKKRRIFNDTFFPILIPNRTIEKPTILADWIKKKKEKRKNQPPHKIKSVKNSSQCFMIKPNSQI